MQSIQWLLSIAVVAMFQWLCYGLMLTFGSRHGVYGRGALGPPPPLFHDMTLKAIEGAIHFARKVQQQFPVCVAVVEAEARMSAIDVLAP